MTAIVPSSLPPPSRLMGLVESKYDFWFPGQEDLFKRCLDWYYSPARFLGMAVSAGSGKSITALLLARFSGVRTVIITNSKGLQRQYEADAAPVGGVIVIGQNNFQCLLNPILRADEGPCHDGTPCPDRESCPYRIQLAKALRAKIIITNYPYWLAQTNYSSGLGEIGLVIADEAHDLFPGALDSFLTVYLNRMDLEPCGVSFPCSVEAWDSWCMWAESASPHVEADLSRLERDIKQHHSRKAPVPGSLSRAYRSTKSVLARLNKLSHADESWVIQPVKSGYRFVPRWVANYAGQLWQKVPKIVMMSAVLSHRAADYLGVPRGEDRAWIEAASYFPAKNTPIWHIATVRLNNKIADTGLTTWASRIDQIIQRRLDRKGIIFTVSYERARLLMQRSAHKNIMVTHSTADVSLVVDKFKRSASPLVLVSPTVTTGWDFPSMDGKPQYIIVAKIPYVDTRDTVAQARAEDDKDFLAYLAMGVFIQETSRCTRSFSAQTEVFVVDDAFKWFYWGHKDFAAKWFQARVRGTLETVPDPAFPIGKS